MRCRLSSVLVAFAVLTAPPAAAADLIGPFLGTYEGRSIARPAGAGDELSARDLSVEIRKEARGFSVEWTTIIYRAKGKSDRRKFRIRFAETRRHAIYGAMMATNIFGRAVPHDPLKGDPYFWASIRGKSLFVYGIHVTDDGGYELQSYQRTLTPNGMTVHFRRLRNGEKLREITGRLKRVK